VSGLLFAAAMTSASVLNWREAGVESTLSSKFDSRLGRHRATLTQEILFLRFDYCPFLFHSLLSVTFSTVSTPNGPASLAETGLCCCARVRRWGRSGDLMLALSLTGFDPTRACRGPRK
jgi:hypothetical protein